MQPATAIIVVGPTAVGKTKIAIHLAQHFNTSIISADSRQCYKELTIGTAKPNAGELQIIPHYFINSHTIKEEINAGIFEQYALQYAAEIFSKNKTLIVCGGTGLYVKSFCEGINTMPEIPQNIREKVRKDYEQNGLQWLQEELKKNDPDFFSTAEIHNPHRLMRALEVYLTTGKSITHFWEKNIASRNFNIIKTGLTPPKKILHEQINARVDKMIANGLVEETKNLLPYRHHNALQTVGYREIFDYIDGKYSLQTAIENIKIHTRQYAKRQMTWFKKDAAIKWFDAAGGEEKIIKYLEEQIAQKK